MNGFPGKRNGVPDFLFQRFAGFEYSVEGMDLMKGASDNFLRVTGQVDEQIPAIPGCYLCAQGEPGSHAKQDNIQKVQGGAGAFRDIPLQLMAVGCIECGRKMCKLANLPVQPGGKTGVILQYGYVHGFHFAPYEVRQ